MRLRNRAHVRMTGLLLGGLAVGLLLCTGWNGVNAASAAGRVSMADLLTMLARDGGQSVHSTLAANGHLSVKTPANSSCPLRIPVQAAWAAAQPGDSVKLTVKRSGAAAAKEAAVPSPGTVGCFEGVADVACGVLPEPGAAPVPVVIDTEWEAADGRGPGRMAGPGMGLQVDVWSMDPSCDRDANGLPDVLGSVNPGEMWCADAAAAAPDSRQSIAVNLDSDSTTGFVSVCPARGLSVQLPSLRNLIDAGVLPAEEEGVALTALGIVQSGPVLAGLTDTPETAIPGLPNASPMLPWPTAEGRDLFLSVTIAYSIDGGVSYETLHDLALGADGQVLAMPPAISISDAAPAMSRGGDVYSYPLSVELGAMGATVATPDTGGQWQSMPPMQALNTGGARAFVTKPGLLVWSPPTALPEVAVDGPQPEGPAADSGELSVTRVAPNAAWLMGGVVVTLTGSGFSEGMEVCFGPRKAAVVAVINEHTAKAVVPPSPDRGIDAILPVSLSVRTGSASAAAPAPFEYLRYATLGGVHASAFIVDDPSMPMPGLNAALGAGSCDAFATLDLPALCATGTQPCFVLARFVQPSVNAQGTQAPESGWLAQHAPESGQAAPGMWSFDLHVYRNASITESALAELASGYDVLEEVPLPATAANRSAADAPAVRVSLPVPAKTLSYALLAQGEYSLWGFESRHDPVTGQTTPLGTARALYQSQVLATEVQPAYDAAMIPANSGPDRLVRVRLFEGNTFSLRQGAALPAAVGEDIQLDAASQSRSKTDRGEALTLVSPKGGLAWTDQVEFQPSGGAKSTAQDAAVFGGGKGLNEYALSFQTPQVAEPGLYDIVVHLKSGAHPESVTLPEAVEFKQSTSPDWLEPVLVGAGIAAAVIGLAAGGKSGGGGGGACFIATAAYGTPFAEEINVLREVRDTYLLDSALGTAFVDTYYRTSPPIAAQIEGHPVRAALARALLTPMVWLCKGLLAAPAAVLLLLAVLLTLIAGMAIRGLRAHRRSCHRQQRI